MILQLLLEGQSVQYFCIVSAMVVSIVLHELAHGVAAIWEGDRTPIELQHMTANPIVHMGPVSLVAVFVVGLGWGAMPVDPNRFRHRRYGDVLVSLAGPVSNLLLAAAALTALGLWIRWGGMHAAPGLPENARQWLWTFGWLNLLLALFNLAPVPPLDGARVLRGLNRDFRRFIDGFEQPEFLFFGYFFLIMAMGQTEYGLFQVTERAAAWVVQSLQTI